MKFRITTIEESYEPTEIEGGKVKTKKDVIIDIILTIFSTIFCLAAVGTIAIFIWLTTTMPESEQSYDFTNLAFINKIGELFLQAQNDVPMLFVFGLAAAFFEIVCRGAINHALQKLPFGKAFTKYENNMPHISFPLRFLPALFTSIYIILRYLAEELFPNLIPMCNKSILYIAICLVSLALLVLLKEALIQSGIWGLILHGSLIIIGNFGITVIYLMICDYLSIKIAMALSVLICIFILPIFLRGTLIGSLLHHENN